MERLLKLLREALPEIIGGLVVAAVLAVAGVLYARFGNVPLTLRRPYESIGKFTIMLI